MTGARAVALGLALILAATGARPAPRASRVPPPLEPLEVLTRYTAALATLKRPKAVSFEYTVEQLGLQNMDQRHRVYRSGRSERDETVVVDGYTLARPAVRILTDRRYRYDVAVVAPRVEAYSFTHRSTVRAGDSYTYVFKTERRGLGQFAVSEVSIDGRSFLPAIIRFGVAGGGARGRGELRFGRSDVYWVVREALVNVRLANGAGARERITWLNYQFPASLPPSTFQAPRVAPSAEPTGP